MWNWGLAIAPNPQTKIPNNQSPIPIKIFKKNKNILIN